MSRLFDGVDDQIVDSPSPATLAVTGALSMIVLVKIAAGNGTWQSFIEMESSGGSIQGALGRRSNNQIYYSSPSTVLSATSITSADGWMLVAMTKASGSVAPSTHKMPIGGARTTAALGSMTSPSTTSITAVRLGGNDDFANIRLGAAAIFSKQLTTTELDGILSAKTTQSIYDLSPIWLADDADGFATELISGRTLTITGAVDDADDPSGWVYGLGGGTDRSGNISFAEFEVPNAPRKGYVSFAELEVPAADRKGYVSFAEFEAPLAPRKGYASFAELEVPSTGRQGYVSFAELEVPDAPRRGLASFSELEVPTAPRRGFVSFAELEIPTAPRQGYVSFAELEVPTAPRRGYVSVAELEAPLAPRRGVFSFAELQIPELASPSSGQRTARVGLSIGVHIP